MAFPVGSTDEFWDSMVKGSAPIQMMKKGLGEALWREKEKLALAWLEETLPALKEPLTSDAWLGVGVSCGTTSRSGLSAGILISWLCIRSRALWCWGKGLATGYSRRTANVVVWNTVICFL
ncbi:Methyltransferase type 11 [Ferriphaselus amnicola]|uniref:Methyltransferase type 11 n=2 Tax=Ferriphaselus amnicola TaxID=1188319 RepID=A0A2Z6GDA2_9PROT|nr:Methyltransferase type 11 [Ferriphaselus amnicola]